MKFSRSFLLRCTFGLLIGLMVASSPGRASDTTVIAAAASLNQVMPEIAQMFMDQTGKRVKISYGSSGNFARQIAQGAPFGMFLSADESYITKLSGLGMTRDDGAFYARGRLALFSPSGSDLVLTGGPESLPGILGKPASKRFAIANPEHAPYGRAARQALVHMDVWDKLSGRLVLGENASQATQFALSGSTQGGLIPYSQALSPAVSGRGAYVVIPESWHAPLRQKMVLMKNASDTARKFFDFMQSPDVRTVLNRYGFTPPLAAQ